tara:strand:+ start:1807 stop:2736 length:930 start_codon:yes stop_codon:yes gene_type:complete
MKIKYYPILVFVYNRPNLLSNLLFSIKKNKNFNKHKYYFFCDGPKNSKNILEKSKIKKNIFLIKKFNKVKKEILIRDKNYGLASNIIEGVSNVLKKHKACIILEDDLFLHEECLNFINFGLNKFKDDKSIASISGYSYLHDYEQKNYFNWVKIYRHCSWSWGTWDNVWKKINWNIENIHQIKIEKNLKKVKFLKAGKDIPIFLAAQLQKIINSWAVRFNYHCLNKNLLSLVPTHSLVKNDGFGINSTHNINFFNKKKITFKKYLFLNLSKLQDPKLSRKLNKIIQLDHPFNKKLFLRIMLTKFLKNLVR